MTVSDRAMSAKWFVSLANRSTKTSPMAFLLAHQEWLKSGELAETAGPILVKLDTGSMLAKQALDEIKTAAFHHLMAQEAAKLEASANETASSSGGRTSDKPYTAYIKDEDDNIMTVKKAVVQNFDHIQSAERWAATRLTEGNPDWHADIRWNAVISPKTGEPKMTEMDRIEAYKVLKKTTHSQFLHTNKVSVPSKPMMKVRDGKQAFSRG